MSAEVWARKGGRQQAGNAGSRQCKQAAGRQGRQAMQAGNRQAMQAGRRQAMQAGNAGRQHPPCSSRTSAGGGLLLAVYFKWKRGAEMSGLLERQPGTCPSQPISENLPLLLFW